MPSQTTVGFFKHNFTRLDWGILLTATAMLFGAIWFVVNLSIAASSAGISAEVAQVRADLVVLNDDVRDTKEELTEAFEKHASSVNETFDQGMKDRTDELSRALLDQMKKDQWLTVYVTNIPRNDQKIMSLVDTYMQNYGINTRQSFFADKVNVSSRLEDLDSMKARSLQRLLEQIYESYPNVDTKLRWEDRHKSFIEDKLDSYK